MTVPRDIQTWLPTLDAMLQDASPRINLVEGAITFAEHSFGWSLTYDGTDCRGGAARREDVSYVRAGQSPRSAAL